MHNWKTTATAKAGVPGDIGIKVDITLRPTQTCVFDGFYLQHKYKHTLTHPVANRATKRPVTLLS